MAFDPFSAFDFPGTIMRHAVTKATRNQTTGAYVAASEVVTTITGSLDRLTSDGADSGGLARDAHDDYGLHMMGGLRFYTEADLAVEDRIEVAYPGVIGTRFFRVKGIPREYLWLENLSPAVYPQRREYLLMPEEPAR